MDRQIRPEGTAKEPHPAFEATRPRPARISPELRQQMIRDTAYFLAERRDFAEKDPVQDWMEAEAEIDRLLSKQQGITARK